LDLRFVTPDHDGGVWITGSAWLLRGLMVHDRNGQVDAVTISGVGNISKPLYITRNVGWMIDVRSLYKTQDGGLSWQRVQITNQPDIRTFHFIDVNNGWVAGWDGAIYRTVDAGQTWKKQETGLDYEFDEIFFIDSSHGWANGFKPNDNQLWDWALIRTNDGGDSWEIVSRDDSSSTRFVNSITFISVNEGWAIDGQNNIVHTVDGGNTWKLQQPSEGHSWSSLFFINDCEGWASGDGVLHTSDGGKTWNYQLDRKRGEDYLDAITFTDSKHGWVIGINTALRTTDGGAIWTRMADDWKEMIPTFQTLLKENSLKTARKQHFSHN
jgi:photosystem II stability/assembly factor-like uncharacterized protein